MVAEVGLAFEAVVRAGVVHKASGDAAVGSGRAGAGSIGDVVTCGAEGAGLGGQGLAVLDAVAQDVRDCQLDALPRSVVWVEALLASRANRIGGVDQAVGDWRLGVRDASVQSLVHIVASHARGARIVCLVDAAVGCGVD